LKEVGGACSIYGESRSVHTILLGKPEGERTLEGPRRTWDDNITMDLKKVGIEVMNWIELVQDRDNWQALVNAVMNLWVP
jgi:hypothetical protein